MSLGMGQIGPKKRSLAQRSGNTDTNTVTPLSPWSLIFNPVVKLGGQSQARLQGAETSLTRHTTCQKQGTLPSSLQHSFKPIFPAGTEYISKDAIDRLEQSRLHHLEESSKMLLQDMIVELQLARDEWEQKRNLFLPVPSSTSLNNYGPSPFLIQLLAQHGMTLSIDSSGLAAMKQLLFEFWQALRNKIGNSVVKKIELNSIFPFPALKAMKVAANVGLTFHDKYFEPLAIQKKREDISNMGIIGPPSSSSSSSSSTSCSSLSSNSQLMSIDDTVQSIIGNDALVQALAKVLQMKMTESTVSTGSPTRKKLAPEIIGSEEVNTTDPCTSTSTISYPNALALNVPLIIDNNSSSNSSSNSSNSSSSNSSSSSSNSSSNSATSMN
jgi:hypothetical protein